MNLEKINQEIEKIVHDRDWDKFHSVKNLSMALSVESSELLEIFQWMAEGESNNLEPKIKAKVEDEVADIFVYLMRIVSKTNIDLEKAVFAKLKKNAEKYPIDKAKGNSLKYTDFGP